MATDRRLAEMKGLMRALSDEMQDQIRRVDGMERRLWEVRCQLNEKVELRCSQLERSAQKSASESLGAIVSLQQANQRHAQQFAALEEDSALRKSRDLDTKGALLTVCSRLEELASQVSISKATPEDPGASKVLTAAAATSSEEQCPAGGTSSGGTGGPDAASEKVGNEEVLDNLDAMRKDIACIQDQLAAQEERWQAFKGHIDRSPQHSDLETLRSEMLRSKEVPNEIQKLTVDLKEVCDRLAGLEEGALDTKASLLKVRSSILELEEGAAETKTAFLKESKASLQVHDRLSGLEEGAVETKKAFLKELAEVRSEVAGLSPQFGDSRKESHTTSQMGQHLLNEVDAAIDMVQALRAERSAMQGWTVHRSFATSWR
eukprot:TRINITY_DN93562_c0_g1_i1.p1 TRINITY_DN93562_c0_g1~~TRINITY_DN93562_c0_g1_i1.p1  ORF type:complete len:420 (+),score=111.94 TRINITY_DN93562_c0_g1_i1:134-1261(+)